MIFAPLNFEGRQQGAQHLAATARSGHAPGLQHTGVFETDFSYCFLCCLTDVGILYFRAQDIPGFSRHFLGLDFVNSPTLVRPLP